MRRPIGAVAVSLVALFLGLLSVTQFRSQDVYSRSLQQETPSSLATLIASLSDRNNSLRDEIFDLRLRVQAAEESVASGRGSLTESQRQLSQLRVLTAESPVRGPGIAVSIDGPFDDRALADLVNELRNAGAEAIAVDGARIGPRSWFAGGPSGSIVVDGGVLTGPWVVRAIGAQEVLYVAITRTGGIVGQFALIYPRTRFATTKESALELPGRAIR